MQFSGENASRVAPIYVWLQDDRITPLEWVMPRFMTLHTYVCTGSFSILRLNWFSWCVLFSSSPHFIYIYNLTGMLYRWGTTSYVVIPLLFSLHFTSVRYCRDRLEQGVFSTFWRLLKSILRQHSTIRILCNKVRFNNSTVPIEQAYFSKGRNK